jgi:NadR type nicotinamide-nucleotide adenylyltransferase
MEAEPGRPLSVVLTGSESTGKSRLAAGLAARYAAPCSAEFARAYLEGKGAPLVAADVEPIARGQIATEDAALARAARLVLKDTDLISTVVYARHYYGACPAWIEAAARARRGDLYLLCHADVPWAPDGLQHDRPDRREEIHGLFAAALREFGARCATIRGAWERRRLLAEAAIDALLAGR